MLLLSRADILSVFSMRDAIESDKRAFVTHSGGEAKVPMRINLETDDKSGQIMFMPAYIGGEVNAAGVKIVSFFPANAEKGLPVVPATVAVMDCETGIIKAIVEGTTLTQLRAAAIAGVATELLSNPDSRVGALMGTGGQAVAQLEALMTVRRFEEIRVYDVAEERAFAFADNNKSLADHFETALVPVITAQEAVTDADVITTVTTSKKPVFDARDIKPGCHINGIGSYMPDKRELPLEILLRASKIYTDSFEAAMTEAGDFIIPIREGKFSEDRVTGELGELILGLKPGRTSPEEITIMKTVGFAALDIVTASDIVRKAEIAGIGMRVRLFGERETTVL